jgi:hypothetical protein
VTSINWCQALEAAVRDARAETGVKCKICRTISGGRTVRGSAIGEMAVIFSEIRVVAESKLERWGVHNILSFSTVYAMT